VRKAQVDARGRWGRSGEELFAAAAGAAAADAAAADAAAAAAAAVDAADADADAENAHAGCIYMFVCRHEREGARARVSIS